MRKIKMLTLFLVAVILLTACSREERNKRAHDAGQKITEEKSNFIKGIGEGLKDAGKGAAESISEGVSEVFKGANEGFDNSQVKKEVKVSEELNAFLEVTRCEISDGIRQKDSTLTKGFVVYTVFEKDFEGKLVLKAFDKNDKEIARSVLEVNEKSDNSRFVEFPFDKRTAFDLIKYLSLDKRSE